MAGIIRAGLAEGTSQEPPTPRPRQARQRMVHVDDLIEPGAKQILLAHLPPFPWPHPLPRQSISRRVNHESNLQGIPFRETVSRQTRFPQRAVSRFQIKDLGILHGRLNSYPVASPGGTARARPFTGQALPISTAPKP